MPQAPRDRSYRLTPALVASYAGAPAVCLADVGMGRTYRLHAERPRYLASRDLIRRADSGAVEMIGVEPEPEPLAKVARVTIRGPLEQRAGYHDPCAGWTDGYDAIAERMIAAFADADVHLVIDSPGGSVLGLFECVDQILEGKRSMSRRVTVAIDGMAGSAGYCLAATLADEGELYVTRAGMAGSIGARGAHVSEAGALAQSGLEVTEFAYPPGKTAFSPARALDDAGKARGERDIMLAFEAFAQAVEAARPALTRKRIVALDADMLTGASAVSAGLVDAVASLQDVEAWALTRAEGEDMPEEENKTKAGDEMPPESEKPGARAATEKAACARCGETPSDDARYCAKCGAKVTADDDAPDSERAEAQAVQRGPQATYSSMSAPALKAAATTMHAKLDRVARAVGAKSHAEIDGALEAVVGDAKKAKRYREERNSARGKAEAQERIDILRSLATAGVHPRGELLVDIVDDGGKVTGLVPAQLWGDGPEGRTLANLRGYARSKLDGVPVNERSPFDKAPADPDRTAAAAIPEKARAEAAKKNPVVQSAARSGIPIDDAAAIMAREFPEAIQ